MQPLMVLQGPERRAVWPALQALDGALRRRDREAVAAAYAGTVRALLTEARADPASAVAAALLEEDTPLARAAQPPAGQLAAMRADLTCVMTALRRNWTAEALELGAGELPPLEALADAPSVGPWEGAVAELADALLASPVAGVQAWLLRRFREHGAGTPARYLAMRWQGGELRGVAHPAMTDATALVGVDAQLRKLHANTEALLTGAPAHNVLLYGPRGSGKSTAVRSLLSRYGHRGLRLVELAGEQLERLPEVVERLRAHPQRFVLYVDDLSFERDDSRYHPLKTLLEGSLSARPANVALYATSNRRHLLRERFSDRPEPGEDDDVHAWDTHNERLALADRFGLTVTFPSASQRHYLGIVAGLAEREGLRLDDLRERAVRFADWGNGYSGRTARQFIDAVLQERATGLV